MTTQIEKIIVTWWWNIMNERPHLIPYTYNLLKVLPKTLTVKKCLYSIKATSVLPQQTFQKVEGKDA